MEIYQRLMEEDLQIAKEREQLRKEEEKLRKAIKMLSALESSSADDEADNSAYLPTRSFDATLVGEDEEREDDVMEDGTA